MTLDQLITDHLTFVLQGRPYAEVADLLHDDPFVADLANAIRELIKDALEGDK